MYTVDKFVWYLVKTKQHTFIADSHSVVYHILINPVIRIADMVTITMIHLCDSGSMLVTSASVETCSIVPFDQPPEATYPESCSYVCMLKWSWSHYWHIFPTPDLSPATCHDDHDHPPTGDMYQCPTGGHRYWSLIPWSYAAWSWSPSPATDMSPDVATPGLSPASRGRVRGPRGRDGPASTGLHWQPAASQASVGDQQQCPEDRDRADHYQDISDIRSILIRILIIIVIRAADIIR